MPGSYQLRLTAGKEVVTVPFEVWADPRGTASQADLEALLAFLLSIRDELSQIHREIARIRAVRAELDELLAVIDRELARLQQVWDRRPAGAQQARARAGGAAIRLPPLEGKSDSAGTHRTGGDSRPG